MNSTLLFSRIAGELEKAIEEGRFEIGDKLPSERKLAKKYEISRNVVRQALTILREKGLIVIKPGKGAYVVAYSENKLTESLKRVVQKYNTSLEEILEVREELEFLVVKKAIDHVTDENIKKLEQLCQYMDESTNVDDFLKWDLEFHKELARATQNSILYILVSSFFDILEDSPFLLTKYTINYIEIIETAKEQHYQLVSGLKNKDRDMALKFVKDHMKLFKKEIDFIQNRNSLLFPKKE